MSAARLDLTRKWGAPPAKALQVLESLYLRPIVSVQAVAEIAKLSFANANALVRQIESLDLLRETTGQRRNRRFSYKPYLALFGEKQA